MNRRKYRWKYRILDGVCWSTLPAEMIRPWLEEFIRREWEQDRNEFPDQPWTVEWLEQLTQFSFRLEKTGIERILPREDLMNYNTPGDNFARSLEKRADELQESFRRGASLEPLLLNGRTGELMDGYTRYTVLGREGVSRIWAYIGYGN